MPYAASHSRLPDTRQALETVCREVSEQLGGALPDLSFLFVSRSHAGFAQTAALTAVAVSWVLLAVTRGRRGEVGSDIMPGWASHHRSG